MALRSFKNIGPGIIVAAAFIGPGTVTLCSIAGVNYSYALLWAVLLSTGATIVLQEMAARIGLVTQSGLAELLRGQLSNSLWRRPVLWLILLAIVMGNTAYQAGNLGGGVLGLTALFGSLKWTILGVEIDLTALILGLIAYVVLSQKSDKILTRILTLLVLFMSISFVITAFLIQPNISELLRGLLIPSLPNQSLWTVIGLIGTTIVPYNIFLHASLEKKMERFGRTVPGQKGHLLDYWTRRFGVDEHRGLRSRFWHNRNQ